VIAKKIGALKLDNASRFLWDSSEKNINAEKRKDIKDICMLLSLVRNVY